MSTKSCAVIDSVQAMQDCVTPLNRSGLRIGLVPTMGALHEGHLSLIRASLAEGDVTIVSIYVNPTQFAANEDLAEYPRTMETDLEQLNSLGVDFVFAPSDTEMYPEGCSTFIQPPAVANKLEGEFRPTHFKGVTTIVAKLFLATNADIAFFGQKDYQQTLVIRKMVADLKFPVEIRVCPTAREPDGLAMSSRNRFLSSADRKKALSISQTLSAAKKKILDGEKSSSVINRWMQNQLIESGIDQLDYALFADADTLEVTTAISFPAVGLVAATVGSTRLIDNLLIREADDS